MNTEHLNRRDFARVSLGAAAGASIATVAGADDPQRDAVEAQRPDKADRDDAPPREEELLLEVIRQRYPNPRLHGKALAGIRGDLRNDLRRSKVLRSFPLSNGDEPSFTFAAYRKDAIR